MKDRARQHRELLRSRASTRPFEVGKRYLRHDGVEVTCLELNEGVPGYETARFDDPLRLGGGHRYNRDQDRGRVTGTCHKFTDPRNIIPEAI